MPVDDVLDDEEWAESQFAKAIGHGGTGKRKCRLVDIDRGEPYKDGDKWCVVVTRYYECEDGGSKTEVKKICYRSPE